MALFIRVCGALGREANGVVVLEVGREEGEPADEYISARAGYNVAPCLAHCSQGLVGLLM